MMGHTDKTTINQRRPLTPGMRDLLAVMLENEAGDVPEYRLTQRDKNIMRGLRDRGLVAWHIETRTYSVTAAGRLKPTEPTAP